MRLRFGLKNLMLWIVPYIAIATAILTQEGPYLVLPELHSDAVNSPARAYQLALYTLAWAGGYGLHLRIRRPPA